MHYNSKYEEKRKQIERIPNMKSDFLEFVTTVSIYRIKIK